jgi:hypothetical protein
MSDIPGGVMESERELQIGESHMLKRSFMTSTGIIYGGMVNESVYSIVVTFSSGHNSLAYNLYIPVTQKTLAIAKREITVYSVSRYSFRFRCN